MIDAHREDPDGALFNQMYASARGGDPRDVPWAHAAPHPMIEDWLETAGTPPRAGATALVIGSGLGDDAEALASRGWKVTAFDISPQAIEWTRERFPDSAVDYQVANLLELPATWEQGFDLVLEIHTVQSLPVTRRQAAIRAIADTVAPGGELIAVAMTRNPDVPLRGRPWPLTVAELRSFERCGLATQQRVTRSTPEPNQPGRARWHLTRAT